MHDIGNDSVYAWDFCKLTGGIVIANGIINPEKKPLYYNTTINDAIVDGCTVRYIKRWTCISISSGMLNHARGNANRIRNCTVEYSVADGIRMNRVQNSFIESSTMYKNGAWPKSPNPDWGGLGAWFFDAENCTIQFCEASHVDNWHNDGGAFDIDYYQKNSTIQYCYGHDCHGYGASVFGADAGFPTENSVVRYNIFSNNARDSAYAYQGDIYVFTWNGGLLNGVKVYNNTSYWNPAADAAAFMCDADFTGSLPNVFKNNIIYSDHPRLAYLKNDSMQCDHNIYWVSGGKKPEWIYRKKAYHSFAEWQKATGQDEHSMYTDPMLQAPSYHGRGMPVNQFRLKKGSPAISAGTDVGQMGSRDFFGEPASTKKGKYDIGAASFGEDDSKHKTDHSKSIYSEQKNAAANELLKRARGHTALLSFINIGLREEKDMQAMRAQLAFLKSMKRQYAEKGLKIILVNVSLVPDSEWKNFISDQELEQAITLQDNQYKMAAASGVTAFPTTFLLTKEGIINQRWENTVQTGQLALAIKNLSRHHDDWSTPAQTIFPGLPAARSLSKSIWLVDGGKSWKKGSNMVRLLVLSDTTVRIKLKTMHEKKGSLVQTLSNKMEMLPEEESKMLLTNMPGEGLKLYSTVLPISIAEDGRYTLQAVVSSDEGDEVLFSGSMRMVVGDTM